MLKLLIKSIVFFSLTLLFFFYLSLYPPTFYAKYIVKKNYEYFVLAKNNNFLKNLYFDFVVQRFFINNFLKEEKNVNNILISTKKFIVDQPELRKYFALQIGDKYWNVSTGSIIISGFGACEAVNAILALSLQKKFKDISLFALYNQESKTSNHVLLMYDLNNEKNFVDIWGVNGLHHFSFESNKDKIDEKYILNYNKHTFDNGFVMRQFTLQAYIKRFVQRLYKKSTYNKRKKNQNKLFNSKVINNADVVDSKVLFIPNQEVLFKTNQNLDNNENYKNINLLLFDRFIDARFEHISGNLQKAYDIYNDIIESECSYDFCRTTKILVEKKFYPEELGNLKILFSKD